MSQLPIIEAAVLCFLLAGLLYTALIVLRLIYKFLYRYHFAMFGLRSRAQVAKAAPVDWDRILQAPILESDGYYSGLVNAGGTSCFLNSVLQSMSSLPVLDSHLRALLQLARQLDPKTPPPVTAAVYVMLSALNTTSQSPSKFLSQGTVAIALYNSSPSRREIMQAAEQQDAQEFLILLLESISEEREKLEKLLRQSRESSTGILELLSESRNFFQAPTIPSSPFQALMAHRTSCMRCGYTEAIRHLPTEQISLTVPPQRSCRLGEILSEYTKLELLDDFCCRRCLLKVTQIRLQEQFDRISASSEDPLTISKKKRLKEMSKNLSSLAAVLSGGAIPDHLGASLDAAVSNTPRPLGQASKQAMFAHPPPILSIHLSRSTYFPSGYGVAHKNACRVVFEEYLDLAKWTTTGELSTRPNMPISSTYVEEMERLPEESEDILEKWLRMQNGRAKQESEVIEEKKPAKKRSRITYRLCSLVVHFGTHDFGHYVAYRRKPRQSLDDKSGEWLRISDETVHSTSIDEVLRANPFLLFYERVDIANHDKQEVEARVFQSYQVGSKGAAECNKE